MTESLVYLEISGYFIASKKDDRNELLAFSTCLALDMMK